MKIFLPKDWMMMDDDEAIKENGNNSLQAIKEHPEEEGEEDERMMMRQIVEEERDARGNQGDEGLNVGRYESIFDEWLIVHRINSVINVMRYYHSLIDFMKIIKIDKS